MTITPSSRQPRCTGERAGPNPSPPAAERGATWFTRRVKSTRPAGVARLARAFARRPVARAFARRPVARAFARPAPVSPDIVGVSHTAVSYRGRAYLGQEFRSSLTLWVVG